MIAFGAALGALVGAALAAGRLLFGPTLQDRALAGVAILNKFALVCAAAGFASGERAAVAAAFALLLSGYVVNFGMLKLFRFGSWQPPMARPR
jgi:multisubunit Na+/H+ antiporter MnhF subunit